MLDYASSIMLATQGEPSEPPSLVAFDFETSGTCTEFLVTQVATGGVVKHAV